MDFHRWTDRSQPQTLQMVVILFYINAVFGVLTILGAPVGSNANYATAFFVEILKAAGVISNLDSVGSLNVVLALVKVVGFAMVAAQALAGLSLANERKWGFRFSIALVAVELAGLLALAIDGAASAVFSLSGVLSLLFIVVALVLLVHHQSREYVKVWFR